MQLLALQDGSDVLQFQRFRVFHPLPKQAHHGILKTLWDKRVQWNQGLNARRTKQLLQAFLDQDVRLGIPSQALPLPVTAPRPAVTAAVPPTPVAATAPVPASAMSDPSVVSRTSPATSAATSPAKAAAAATAGGTAASAAAEVVSQTMAEVVAEAKRDPSPAKAAAAQSKGSARTRPWIRPRHRDPHSHLSNTNTAAPLASTPVSNPVHEGKGHALHAMSPTQGQLEPSQGLNETAPARSQEQTESVLSQPASPAQLSDSADFDSGTPATTSSQSDATNFESFDMSQAAGADQYGDGLGQMGEDVLPNLPPLHLSKAQHRYANPAPEFSVAWLIKGD